MAPSREARTRRLRTLSPLTAARGTVDNLSAYLRLERQLATKGTCAMTVPVFDGRHLYDLVFTDGGQQTLKPEGGQNFEGRRDCVQDDTPQSHRGRSREG